MHTAAELLCTQAALLCACALLSPPRPTPVLQATFSSLKNSLGGYMRYFGLYPSALTLENIKANYK